MAPPVRPARSTDVPGIVEWTTDTFDWGDYVPERIDGWLTDPNSQVLVHTDDSDKPVAMVHVTMLSRREGWLEAARVQPGHRRSGLASTLNLRAVAWARERGAAVVRLATEAENHAARSQVESLGYRKTSSWVYAWIQIAPEFRFAPDLRPRPAPSSDVDAAWMFWSTSELAHGGRSFIADGWQWRKAHPRDLLEAAASSEFYQNPAGWAIVGPTEDDVVEVRWVATTTEEAPRLLEGLLGLASDREATAMTIKVPNLPWAAEALKRAGGDPKEILVYSLAV